MRTIRLPYIGTPKVDKVAKEKTTWLGESKRHMTGSYVIASTSFIGKRGSVYMGTFDFDPTVMRLEPGPAEPGSAGGHTRLEVVEEMLFFRRDLQTSPFMGDPIDVWS